MVAVVFVAVDSLEPEILQWPWVKIQIVPPVSIPTPTKSTEMGGEFTYPKMGSHWF